MKHNLLHMTDYLMYNKLFGCQEIRSLWSEEAILQQWCDFESYLAQAQAEADAKLAEAEQDIERRRTEFARQCEEMVRGQEVLRRLMEAR